MCEVLPAFTYVTPKVTLPKYFFLKALPVAAPAMTRELDYVVDLRSAMLA
jgi:hypothetical protein